MSVWIYVVGSTITVVILAIIGMVLRLRCRKGTKNNNQGKQSETGGEKICEKQSIEIRHDTVNKASDELDLEFI